MDVIRNARIDEHEARKDADAIRLFSTGLSASSTTSALLQLYPRATFPPGMCLVLTSAQSAASSQNSSPEVTPRKAAVVPSSVSAQSAAFFSQDSSPELLPPKKVGFTSG